jgi:hypothetical protein
MQTTPTTLPTYEAVKTHGEGLIHATIGAHPVAAAVVMGVLVLIIIILGYYVAHYRAMTKDHFQIVPMSNLTTGSNNPLWQLGSMDAGNWGPIHREPTQWNIAAYTPSARMGYAHRGEGFEGGYPGPCPPGELPIVGRDGSVQCVSSGPEHFHGRCGAGWDPAASAETAALATTGSFQHEPVGERRLQRAINAAFDPALGLSDEQLTTLMHQGGAP